MDFKAENFAKSLGDETYFRAVPMPGITFNLDDTNERKLPLQIPYGIYDDYEIEYTIPENY
jgi:hypothetical protein